MREFTRGNVSVEGLTVPKAQVKDRELTIWALVMQKSSVNSTRMVLVW